MEREKIEQAAMDYVKQHYPAWHPLKKHDISLFTQGARWRINSVWHTDLKDAQTRRPLIVEFVSLRIEIFDDKRDLKGIEDLVVRYAYVDDLVPEGNE